MASSDFGPYPSTPWTDLTAAPESSDARKYAVLLARLEAELAHVISQESHVAGLTKERDSLLRQRREVTKKFEAVDVWLGDYAKVSQDVGAWLTDRQVALWRARSAT